MARERFRELLNPLPYIDGNFGNVIFYISDKKIKSNTFVAFYLSQFLAKKAIASQLKLRGLIALKKK